jgi:hypothetical protein
LGRGKEQKKRDGKEAVNVTKRKKQRAKGTKLQTPKGAPKPLRLSHPFSFAFYLLLLCFFCTIKRVTHCNKEYMKAYKISVRVTTTPVSR